MNTRHIIYLVLFIMAVLIQRPLWSGKGGIGNLRTLETEIAAIRASNDELRQNNATIAGEIDSLESGSGAVEEQARMSMEMLRDDEILFRFVPKGSVEPPTLTQYQQTFGSTNRPSSFVPKNGRLYSSGEVK